MKLLKHRLVALVLLASLFAGEAPAAGPLRVLLANPRYFTDGSNAADGSLNAVYLCGSHTWNQLVDMTPEPFDFPAYLDFLEKHHHNFIRLWTWDSSVLELPDPKRKGRRIVHQVAPLPWLRTGPGMARDGRPRFDLTQFDPAYFDRLHERVRLAGERGMYVSVMLFEGWGLMHGAPGKDVSANWAWLNHPLHPDNQINGFCDGLRGRVHALGDPRLRALQVAYLRRVVDTVNGFDNVLYEVVNEGGQRDWDLWVMKIVRAYEKRKPKQHAIGLTGHGAQDLKSLLASPADWTSPGIKDGFGEDPPAWNEDKVSLLDTDHVWGIGGDANWVWKSFTRGHNPIFMDPYQGEILGDAADPRWEPLRKAMGHSRRLAQRLNMAAMRPHDELAGSGFCLAEAGVAYVVFQSAGGETTLDLSGVEGAFDVEWIHPVEGTCSRGAVVHGGGTRALKAPFAGAAVCFVRRSG